jgi:hypothetical protein
MGKDAWREEVASLLERCAASIRAHRDRQAGAEFGTATAYLQRAEDGGDRGAAALLEQVCMASSLDRTERFEFSPGELENLANQGKK